MENLKDKISDLYKDVKGSWWVPSIHEFLAFGVLIALCIILVIFFHHSSIQQTVKKSSRCLAEKKSLRSGIYSVTASNKKNEPMYRVAYNMEGKQYSVECACPEGKFTNEFKNIQAYNLKTRQSDTLQQKYCQCATDVEEDDPLRMYYSGYPGLVRYMRSGDTSFFETLQG